MTAQSNPMSKIEPPITPKPIQIKPEQVKTLAVSDPPAKEEVADDGAEAVDDMETDEFIKKLAGNVHMGNDDEKFVSDQDTRPVA